MSHTPRERFESKFEPVTESGCWIWLDHLNRDGYGNLFVKGRCIKAHRFSYELFVGPAKELCVCHRCDTPCCVNPAHLFLGDHAANMRDMALKGRANGTANGLVFIGESHPRARLTAKQVERVRSSKETGSSLAREYGVARSTISMIRTGRNWRAA